MRTSSDRFTISANARTRPVDNRISLRFYYRIADNLLKQADIFREEKNFVDLYIMLLRFSSLVTETIPYHKDYKVSLQREKLLFRKKSLNAMSEAEVLKPAVQRKIEELNRISTSQVNGCSPNQNNYSDSSLEWPPVKKFPPLSPKIRKIPGSVGRGGMYEASHIQKDKYSLSMSDPVEEQLRKFSISVPRPKEETLSRHSILGPNGLWGQWQPPISNIRVQYPSNLDLTPIDIPSFQQPLQDEVPLQKDSISESEKSSMAAVLSLSVDAQSVNGEEPSSMIAFDVVEPPIQSDIIRQPSPPPVLADVHDLMPTTSPQASEWGCELPDELVRSKSPLQLHISTTMMENFLRLAKSNTDKNLETCGILAGSLKNRKFFVTALIIPKQESTSDLCQATNEEEIFDVQDKQSLFPLGWIHTHPSQSCFMSSIDVHTHYSYQIMLPEAVAIVMAPKDSSRTHGVFRLTNPGGMQVIRHCDRRGFHTHEQPPDGGPIYDHCTDVYMNPNLKIDVIDLRS